MKTKTSHESTAQNGSLTPYKLHIFLNPFRLDNRRRGKLKSILRRDGRTALWLYAPVCSIPMLKSHPVH